MFYIEFYDFDSYIHLEFRKPKSDVGSAKSGMVFDYAEVQLWSCARILGRSADPVRNKGFAVIKPCPRMS